jgi:hypothetical protein
MTYLIENKRVCLQKTGSWARAQNRGIHPSARRELPVGDGLSALRLVGNLLVRRWRWGLFDPPTRRGTGLDGAPEKPDAMPVDDYARLLDEILQAETQAYQARADWTRRFVAWIVDRSKPPFTL